MLVTRHSYLLTKIIHRDPFLGISAKRMNLKLEFADYAEDQRFLAAVASLRRSGVPLTQLPQFRGCERGFSRT
jgi:hypothetical protein